MTPLCSTRRMTTRNHGTRETRAATLQKVPVTVKSDVRFFFYVARLISRFRARVSRRALGPRRALDTRTLRRVG